MLLGGRALHEGHHLPRTRGAAAQGTQGRGGISKRPRRYTLRLPTTRGAARASTSTTALSTVFGEDELGRIATSLFQSALATGTKGNYESNLGSFFSFCEEFLLDPLGVGPIDIAHYLAWLGQRGTIAAESLQPYLSAINRLLQDHARPPVALGPFVTGVRKGLANCQEDTAPQAKRLPLQAPVMLSILELAEGLFPSIH